MDLLLYGQSFKLNGIFVYVMPISKGIFMQKWRAGSERKVKGGFEVKQCLNRLF